MDLSIIIILLALSIIPLSVILGVSMWKEAKLKKEYHNEK